jgi:5-(carboxyamino)imidazole ribonucleotide synthase
MHIAIFGCGQLARMLALAGWPMGIRFSFIADGEEDTRCVEGLGSVLRLHSTIAAGQLFEELGKPDVITIEKEAVSTTLLDQLSLYCTVAPNAETLWRVQHRARQKEFLHEHKIPIAPYVQIHEKPQLLAAAAVLGYPLIIKSCEQGYDGQQQWRIHTDAEVRGFIDSTTEISDAVVEKMLDFSMEVSVLGVRNSKGEIALYEPSENHHRNGILSVSISPPQSLSPQQRIELESIVAELLCRWNYVGVLAIECFVVDGKIVVNEIAPRVHNSGHWTQNGAVCNQFENHLRAICGQTLGSTASLGHCAMINLLGCDAPDELISWPHAHLHWYNKKLRPGRKMGHINLLHEDSGRLQKDLNHALGLLAVG